MAHHTKDKGDLAVGQVIADLLTQGIQVCLPISEHLPFDLVAVSPDGTLLRRIQVKYRTAEGDQIEINMRHTSYTNGRGMYSRPPDHSAYDAVAVYAPDHGVFYVLAEEIAQRISSFNLFLGVPQRRNSRVRQAALYRDALVMFRGRLAEG